MPNIKPISDLRNYSAVLEDVTVGWLGVTEEGWLIPTGCAGVCFVSTFFCIFFHEYFDYSVKILINQLLDEGHCAGNEEVCGASHYRYGTNENWIKSKWNFTKYITLNMT